MKKLIIIFLTVFIVSKCTHSIFQNQRGACKIENELEGFDFFNCELAVLLRQADNPLFEAYLLNNCRLYFQKDKKCNKKSDKIPHWIPVPNL